MATFGRRGADTPAQQQQRKPSLVDKFSAMEPKDRRTILALPLLPLLLLIHLFYEPPAPDPAEIAAREAARVEDLRQRQAEKAAAAAERLAATIERRAASCVDDEEDMGLRASSFMQTAVRSRLKSPSSARFPYPTTVSHMGDCRFRIAGYVDAQNGFGAMLRTSYSGTMIYNAVSDDWSLGSLSL